MTYTELVQKIRDYTEVTSTVLTDTIVNGFIENSEFRILRDVDSDNNRRYVTANLIAGQRFIDTPQNLLVIRSAQIVDSELATGTLIKTETFYNIETLILCRNLIPTPLKECLNITATGMKTQWL